MYILPKRRDYKCRLNLVMERALASGNQRHKERSVDFLCYGSHSAPNQHNLRQRGPALSFLEWLPSHAVTGTGQKGTLCGKGCDKPNERAEAGNPAPAFPEVGLIAQDPGTPGAEPQPRHGWRAALVHSASLHENKTPACSGSARHMTGRKL